MDVVKQLEEFKDEHMQTGKFGSGNWFYQVEMTTQELENLVGILQACSDWDSDGDKCEKCPKYQRCQAAFDAIMDFGHVTGRRKR